jgi:hypothetical protein
MTIRLLTPRGVIPIGAIVTLDAATEAALVAEKVATTDLSGGTPYAPPVQKVDRAPIVYDKAEGKAYLPDGQSLGGLGAPVSISGALVIGATLTATPSPGWQFAAGQWYRDGVAINGATGLTYTLQAADGGKAPSFSPTNPVFRAVAGVVQIDTSVPTTLFVKQSIRVIDQTPIARLLHRSSPRDSVVIRNTGATVLQIGFTTNNNNNNNAPGSWSDVAVGEEFYEGDVDHQIWIRAKTAGETVTAQIEVQTPRI